MMTTRHTSETMTSTGLRSGDYFPENTIRPARHTNELMVAVVATLLVLEFLVILLKQ